jgi:WXXGXW repeat (2 copies)
VPDYEHTRFFHGDCATQHFETLFDIFVTSADRIAIKINASMSLQTERIEMKNSLLLLTIVVVMLTGCVHERVIYRDRVAIPSDEIATQAPPEPIHETITVAPSRVHVWIGGRWGWRHGAYAWAPGYWARRPHYHSNWAPGAWARHGPAWRWRHGHWR